jgi:hypothetical protein
MASKGLAGFADFIGFFREYARHYHPIFTTRDDFGEWTQADAGRSGSREGAEQGLAEAHCESGTFVWCAIK